jgi:hypothetical protein
MNFSNKTLIINPRGFNKSLLVWGFHQLSINKNGGYWRSLLLGLTAPFVCLPLHLFYSIGSMFLSKDMTLVQRLAHPFAVLLLTPVIMLLVLFFGLTGNLQGLPGLTVEQRRTGVILNSMQQQAFENAELTDPIYSILDPRVMHSLVNSVQKNLDSTMDDADKETRSLMG